MGQSLDILVTKKFPKTFLSWDGEFLAPKQIKPLVAQITDKTNVYLYKENGGLLKELMDEIELHKITAIDFPQYYQNQLSNVTQSVPKTPYIYVFGIGEELCNNYTFSDKILNAIITTANRRGTTVILVGDIMSPTTFKRNYPISATKVKKLTQVNK